MPRRHDCSKLRPGSPWQRLRFRPRWYSLSFFLVRQPQIRLPSISCWPVSRLTLGFALGLVIAVLLFFYRKRWLSKLRDRLASDGITANEVVWFRSELTSAERAALREIEQSNPLLADAYLETLANRLMASRIISRSKREMLRVERQINRARTLHTPESASLQKELAADHERLQDLRQQATEHLAKAQDAATDDRGDGTPHAY